MSCPSKHAKRRILQGAIEFHSSTSCMHLRLGDSSGKCRSSVGRGRHENIALHESNYSSLGCWTITLELDGAYNKAVEQSGKRHHVTRGVGRAFRIERM